MNNKEFFQRVSDAAASGNEQQARSMCLQALAEKTSHECLYPRNLALQISDLGTMHNLYVRCGKCDFCRSYLQSEWFTRMWHETEFSSHLYMITLTYKGYQSYEAVPEKLRDAYFHLDSVNFTHSLLYRPCLCRIEHLQMFHRNLRRLVDFKYSWFAAMEYGSDYGSPHFHVLIWTPKPEDVLTPSIIKQAWSVNIGSRKQPVWDNIGRVDFEDCNTNGTIQKDITIDHKPYDAKNAFMYLSKYVNKYEAANYQRVNFLRQNLLDGIIRPNDPEYTDVFGNIDYWLNKLYFDDAKLYCNSQDGLGKNFVSPEKLLQDAILARAEDGLNAFSVLFKSRTSCSRAQGIGSLYLKSHLERMVAGNMRISDRKYSSLICPRYYLRKVREVLNPIQRRSQLTGSLSYSAQNRPYQVKTLIELVNYPFSRVSTPEIVQPCDPLSLDPLSLSALLHSPFSFRNAVTGERMIICGSSYDKLESPIVYAFKYDRHKRSYFLNSSLLLADFVEEYKNYCLQSFDYSKKMLSSMESESQALEAAKDIFDAVFYSTDWKYEHLTPYNSYRIQNVDYIREQHEKSRVEKHDKFSKKLF